MQFLRRDDSQGTPYFFTISLRDRESDLLLTHIDVLHRVWHSVLAERPVSVEAVVVMPDHLHAVWRVPIHDMDFVVRWQMIKSGFTVGLRRGSPWRAKVWTRRIEDRDLAEHVDYVHLNPVHHGLAAQAGDWAHSTVHECVRQGLCPPHALQARALKATARRYGERDELVSLLEPASA